MNTPTPKESEYLAAPQRSGIMGDLDVVDPFSVASLLAPRMTRDGYRTHETDDSYLRVYRETGNALEHVPLRTFRALVKELSLTLLKGASRHTRSRRVNDTILGLANGERGADSWVARLTEHTRDRLPFVDEDDLALRVPEHPPSAMPPRDRTASNRARRVALREESLDEARDLLARWLQTLPKGRHDIADVWMAFDYRRNESQSLRDSNHGSLRIGRTTFYALLTEIGTVVNAGGRRRDLVVSSGCDEVTNGG